MTSCCICFNEIQKLIKEDFQCQTCNSGIICHMCFTEKLDYIDTSKYHKKKDVIKEMMVCPCCRQVNWKHYHYVRIVDNMASNAIVFSILFVLMICTLITQNSSGVLVVNQVDFITLIFSKNLDYEKHVLEIFSVEDDVYYQLDH